MAALAVAIFLALAMSMAWRLGLAPGKSGRIDAIWAFATGLACLAAVALGAERPARAAIAAAYLAVWSLRLGAYLWRRAEKSDDPRYAEMKARWGDGAPLRLFGFLQIQGVASWPLAISAYVAAASPRPAPDLRDGLALLIFAIALFGEQTADRQMAAFKAKPENRGRICERGLWAWSRHPNYFFEWLGWLGLPVLAVDRDYLPGGLALLAPAWMYVLLVHVSGVPPLEAAMRRSRGASFEDYSRRVNRFWPWRPLSR